MTLKIFTMGGTIDKVYFDDLSHYEVGEPQVGEILREAKVALDYEIEELMRKDSLHMTLEDRLLLRERILSVPNRLILVTHGTDTMVETARQLLDIRDKVIVFTGSLSPARFKGSDAVFNVGCAVGALQALPAGVFIAMSGRVLPAERASKNREAARFEERDDPGSR